MSDEKHEKIADIVAEMRECDGYRSYYHTTTVDFITKVWRNLL